MGLICVSENVPFSTKTLLILLMSAFFSKNKRFLAKIVSLLYAIVRAALGGRVEIYPR